MSRSACQRDGWHAGRSRRWRRCRCGRQPDRRSRDPARDLAGRRHVSERCSRIPGADAARPPAAASRRPRLHRAHRRGSLQRTPRTHPARRTRHPPLHSVRHSPGRKRLPCRTRAKRAAHQRGVSTVARPRGTGVGPDHDPRRGGHARRAVAAGRGHRCPLVRHAARRGIAAARPRQHRCLVDPRGRAPPTRGQPRRPTTARCRRQRSPAVRPRRSGCSRQARDLRRAGRRTRRTRGDAPGAGPRSGAGHGRETPRGAKPACQRSRSGPRAAQGTTAGHRPIRRPRRRHAAASPRADRDADSRIDRSVAGKGGMRSRQRAAGSHRPRAGPADQRAAAARGEDQAANRTV